MAPVNLILQTPRLYLREFTPADAGLLVDLNSDPAVLQYLHEPLLRDEQQATEILETIIFPQYKNRLGRWATFLKATDEFIGWCGLKYLPDKNEIDLGYRFMRKFWGLGYGTEAARHVLDYGFYELDLSRIVARAHIDNKASLAIINKLGMQYAGDEIIDGCPVKTFYLKNPSKSVKEK